MSLSPKLTQAQPDPNAPPAQSDPGTVTDLVEELETPPEDEVELDTEEPPDEEEPEVDADFPEGWTDAQISAALAKRGYVGLPADQAQELILQAGRGVVAPPRTEEEPTPAEEFDETEFQYAMMTDPKKARNMITEQATRDIAAQNRLVNELVNEVREAVPEIDDADAAVIREKLSAHPLNTLKEVKATKSHIGAAQQFAYNKLKMKNPKPPAKKSVTPPAAPRPDRTNMTPPAKPTERDEQAKRLSEALSKRTRRDITLG